VAEQKTPPLVVLDTNVVLSALVFRSSALVAFRGLWQRGTIVPVVSKPIVQELLCVLAYPRFKLNPADQQTLLAEYLPFAQTVNPDAASRDALRLPVCRDAHDQMFLELAQVASVEYLVTDDNDLLTLEDPLFKPLSFAILAPAALLQRLAS